MRHDDHLAQARQRGDKADESEAVEAAGPHGKPTTSECRRQKKPHLVAALHEALGQVVNVVLHATKIGIEEIGDHEDAVRAGLHFHRRDAGRSRAGGNGSGLRMAAPYLRGQF